MNRWIGMAALLALATIAHAQTTPAKKELVAKVLVLQQPLVESMAREVVERPALQIMQAAGNALRGQVAPDKREALGKSIETDVRKFVDESVPVLRERAIKIAPTTIGATLEEKFSDDELKQLIAWYESPVYKKYQQLGGEMQNVFMQKLMAEAGPLLDGKLQALQQKVRSSFVTATGASAPKPSASAPRAAAQAASK